MKTLTTLLLIITSVFCLSAQDIKYSLKSTEVFRDKLVERSAGLKAIGTINEYAYYLYQPYTAFYSGPNIGGKMKYYIGKFDKDVKLIKKVELSLTQEGKKVDFEGIQIINNRILVFFSFQNEAKKTHYLFSRSVNAETLEPEGDTKMIADLDYSGISKYKRTSVQYEVSKDESKIMFFYTVLNKEGELLKFVVQVYNSELKLIWRNDVSPKFETGVFNYKQFRVDNNADVYLLGVHFADKKNYYESANFKDKGFFSSDYYFTDVPNFNYQLYKFSNKGTKEEYKNIVLDSKFIRSMNFTAHNGKVHIWGIYSNPQTISARGVFSFNYDVSTGKKTVVSSKELSTELIEIGFSEKELKRFKRSIDDKSEYDPFDYIIGEIKTLTDGSKYYTAEQFITGTKVERSGNQVVYSSIYLYNDVFVVRLKADGSIVNIEKISKRQYSLNTDRFNSFINFEKNGSLYFIYNTIKNKNTMFKNAEIGETYISKVGKSGSTKVYKTPESFKVPLIMPVTQVVLHNKSVMYGMMSANFKDYMFELIDVE